jgi:hypothetical protein
MEDVVDSRGLIGGEAQILRELSIFPPGEAKRLSVNRRRQRQQHQRRQQPTGPSQCHA